MQLLRNVVGLIFVGVLAGCGSGGGGLSGGLSLSTPATVNSGEQNSAIATYTAADGRDPIGLKVSFSTNRSDLIALSSRQVSVGSGGAATVNFSAISVPTDTAVYIYAQTGGLTQSQKVVIKGSGVPTNPNVGGTANSIRFVTPSSGVSTTLSLKGYGTVATPETAVVTFEVLDTTNTPLPGQTVDFALDTTLGGITFTPNSGVSDANGRVQTIVSAGIVATPVRVTATVHGTSISTMSNKLTIAGGPPDQDSLSISLSSFNPEGWNYDGTTVTVTARLGDHFNNPVADGTAVYFETNGGNINNSCFTTNGACSVTWTSMLPRPSNGIVTILARAVGEESFMDTNNNGVADYDTTTSCTAVKLPGIGDAQKCGEFLDIPDAYMDINFNSKRDANEPFYNMGGTSTYHGPDKIFEGAFRPESVTGPTSTYIFFNSWLVMSGSFADIDVTPTIVPFSSSVAVTVTVTDENGNPMPKGTTITIASTADSNIAALKFSPGSFTVSSSSKAGDGTTVFSTSASNKFISSSATEENVLVTVTTPLGNTTSKSFKFTYN